MHQCLHTSLCSGAAGARTQLRTCRMRTFRPFRPVQAQNTANQHCTETQQPSSDRRSVMQYMLTTVLGVSSMPFRAAAEEATDSGNRGLSRYIKKKKLDPIDTYIPTVLQARKQLVKAGTVMKQDAQGARTLLRKGSFSGLRDTVKALGEFATDAGMPQDKASQLVSSFLSSLQTLDNTLISSLRSKTPVPDSADKQLDQTVQDLDRLLATVPSKDVEQAQKLLDEVKAMFSEPAKSDKDVEALKQLIPV